MKKFIFIILILFGNCKAMNPPQSTNYLLIVKKVKILKDSGSIKVLTNVELINNTNDTLKYIEWSCPLNSEYSVESKSLILYDYPVTCSGNIPQIKVLSPHNSKIVDIELKFINGSYMQRKANFRMKFYLYDNPAKYMEDVLKIVSKNPDVQILPKILVSNLVKINFK